MPCTDGGPDYGQQRADQLARILCDLCGTLEAQGIPLTHSAGLFWEQHKKADAERAKREEKFRKEKQAQQEAQEFYAKRLKELGA